METPEAEALAASGSYEPMVIYQNDPVIRRVLDQMIHGFGDGVDYTVLPTCYCTAATAALLTAI